MGNALAIRQVSWMDQFQKFVAEQQAKIRKAERMQVPYMCVQDALEGLEDMRINTFKCSVSDSSVYLSFTADDRTTREEYWRVYKAVHDALVLRKQIKPGAGTYPNWDDSLHFSSYFYIRDLDPKLPGCHVFVTMDLPEEGTYNVKVLKTYVKGVAPTYEKYSITWNDELAEPPFKLGVAPKDIF